MGVRSIKKKFFKSQEMQDEEIGNKSLNDLLHIPALFHNESVPAKPDHAYYEKISKKIYNHYLKGPTDGKTGYKGNYLDKDKMEGISDIYKMVQENIGPIRAKETSHIDKEIQDTGDGPKFYKYVTPKPDFSAHMQGVSGWDSVNNRATTKIPTNAVKTALEEWDKDAKSVNYRRREKDKLNEARDMASYVVGLLAKRDKMDEVASRTWGQPYTDKQEYKDWLVASTDKWGGSSLNNVVGSMTESGKSSDFKIASDLWTPGKDVTDSFGTQLWNTVKDVAGGVVDLGVGLITNVYETPVVLGEAIDDIIEGENVLDTLVDTTAKITDMDNLIDAAEDLMEGDIVGAVGNVYEYGYDQAANTEQGSFIGGATPPTSTTLTKDVIETLNEVSDPSNDNLLSDLREDINEVVTGEEEPVAPTKDFKMGNIDKTAMNELKILLGIADTEPDSAVIEALVGSDARKLADNQDISSVLQQQRQVAEQGYDVGEREALSGKARRELAGMARKQGQAAGAAAGGLRGASVAAQSRALSEKAMQKQADVTTEMDKSSIARKDSARTNLANLAKDVTKFDVEKEQEKKKRKGATTIGVGSLLQAEETNKQMMDLANK